MKKQTSSSQQRVSSTSMLNVRMQANSHASRDFDEWCFGQLPELPLNARILDLGCGTGKQLLLFSPVTNPAMDFWALDRSAESLKVLADTYDAPASLHVLEADFDQLDKMEQLRDGSFDLIYGSYALYYTKNLERLVQNVYRLLKPNGIFWNISPYKNTNNEFIQIIEKFYKVEPFMDYVFDDFYQEMAERAQKEGFSSFQTAILRNKITFPTADAFMAYLQNSLFYKAGFDAEILAKVQDACNEKGGFEVSKNVLSLKMRK